jgi:hypothetical protein
MAIDPTKLYRLRPEPENGFYFFRASELADLIFIRESGSEPQNPYCPRMAWYCHDEDCVIRQVETSAKYLDRDPPATPPTMRCPACGSDLEFLHYLHEVTLEPMS